MPKTFLALAFSIAAACPRTAVARQAACNAVTVNGNCFVYIDRERPVTPLPIQAKRGSTVTLVVSTRPFERPVTQETAAETPSPDEFAAILAAFLPALKKGVVERTAASAIPPAAAADDVGEAGRPVAQKLAEIRAAQRRAAAAISATEERTRTVAAALAALQAAKAGEWTVDELKRFLAEFTCAVYSPGPGEARGCEPGRLPVPGRLPTGELSVLEADLADVRRMFGRLDSADRAALSEALNVAAGDQDSLNSRARTVAAVQQALVSAGVALEGIDVAAVSGRETLRFDSHVLRGASTTTVRLAVHDRVSKVETPLATVVINWNASRWELSTGALFSSIPDSTFQVSPVTGNGVSRATASGSQVGVITESQSKPTVVPVVFAHYRFTERAVSSGPRRLALLLTGGIGVNPYSGSADFAGGVTLSYRGFVVSPVAHAARPLRLAGGFSTGQTVTGTPPALVTERYWAVAFALGLSYRIPIK